jgi:hypothetical protein
MSKRQEEVDVPALAGRNEFAECISLVVASEADATYPVVRLCLWLVRGFFFYDKLFVCLVLDIRRAWDYLGW